MPRAATRRGHSTSLLVIFIALATLSGLSFHLREPIEPVSKAESKPAASNYVLKLNGALSPSSAGALIAISDGLFERLGMNVRLLPGSGDADVAASVATDDHVIGLVSAQGFLQARADGLPVVAFGASYIISSVEFFALSNKRLLGPDDFEGKRIGYIPGSEAPAVLRAFIARNCISQSGLKVVESDNALADLIRGDIDILVGRVDVEGRELENSNASYRSLSPDSFGVHPMGTVYIANERTFLSPGTLEKFLTAVVAGWNLAYSDENRTFPIIAAAVRDKSTPAQMSRFMDRQRLLLRPSGARLGELEPAKFRELQDSLVQHRIISQSSDLNVAINLAILDELYRAKSGILSSAGP